MYTHTHARTHARAHAHIFEFAKYIAFKRKTTYIVFKRKHFWRLHAMMLRLIKRNFFLFLLNWLQ